MLPLKISEIFKNTFFKRTPLMVAFVMRFKYNFISTTLILKIKMDVDMEMFAERNGKKFKEMSSLENKERLNEIFVVLIN